MTRFRPSGARRLLPIAVAGLLLLAVVAVACGDDPPSTSDPSPDGSSTTAAPDAAASNADSPDEAVGEEAAVQKDSDDAEADDPVGAEGEEPVAAEPSETEAVAGVANPGRDSDTETDAETGESDDEAAEPEEAEPEPRLDLLIELTDAVDRAVIERIAVTVAERRGLSILREIPVYLLRRSDLAEFLLDDPEDDPGDTELHERLFQLLGIIELDVSLEDLFQDLFVGLALGFYDFDLEGFVIVSANDHISAGDISTITHEFAHALQDQHYQIGDYFEEHRHNSDRILAARFVVEGDARNSEALFGDLEAELVGQLEPRLDRLPGLDGSVPPPLLTIFNAPYLAGVIAISQVLTADGYDGVNALLAELPPSTELLLHAEKLASGEAPVLVADPDVLDELGEGWEELGSDTMGEFILRTVLEAQTGFGVAAQAGAGWGGDRLTLYGSDEDSSVMIWELRWDTESDTDEFMDAVDDWLGGRTGAAGELGSAKSELRFQGDSLAGWVRRVGTSVTLAIGDDRDAVARLAGGVAG
jgi:hypothetical protein